MDVRIHLLTHPDDPSAATIHCRARDATRATWDRAMVTCPACLVGTRAPCTCAFGQTCAACRTWDMTHHQNGAHKSTTHMSEKVFQAEVMKALRRHGWQVYHTWQSRHSAAGFPDLCAVRGPRLFFAELKRVGKSATPEQQQWLTALAQVEQVHTCLWTPADLDTLLTFLQ